MNINVLNNFVFSTPLIVENEMQYFEYLCTHAFYIFTTTGS